MRRTLKKKKSFFAELHEKCSLVHPVMEYADVLWDGCTESESNLLEHVQYEAAKIETGATKGTNTQRLMQETGWEDMKFRRAVSLLLLYFKIICE